MRPLTINFTGESFHVEGYPSAVKLIGLDHPQARWFADLALHESDLDLAIGCLEGINHVPETPPVLREGLWRSACVHVLKCFDATAERTPLTAERVYASAATALQVFDYFKKLRNKHFAHDENAWLQSCPAVVLNPMWSANPVEDVIWLAFRVCTLNQPNYANLLLLATTARGWIIQERDRLHAAILADLRRADHDELLRRPSLEYRSPAHSDIGRKK